MVTRLTSCLILIGLAFSLSWGTLQWHRRHAELRLDLTHQVTGAVQHLQATLQPLLRDGEPKELEQALAGFRAAQSVRAVQLTVPGRPPLKAGDWSLARSPEVEIRPMPQEPWLFGRELSLDRPTLLQTAAQHSRTPYLLEVLIDGPGVLSAYRNEHLREVRDDTLLIVAVTLLALLLLRRWVAMPLAETAELVRIGGRATTFLTAAEGQRGEFRELNRAVGEMLGALDAAHLEIARREANFAALYRHAPSAMIEIDPTGLITGANLRGGEAFGDGSNTALVGRRARDLVHPEDAPLLDQAIERLRCQETASCHLRMRDLPTVAMRDAAVQLTAARDPAGQICGVQASFTDVTDLKRLQRGLHEKTRLLDLLIDHIPDAALLTDAEDRLVACNRQATRLLRLEAPALAREPVTHERVWDGLGALDPQALLNHVRSAQARPDARVECRVETQSSVLMLRGIPVADGDVPAGRLWMLHDVTQLEQHERQAAAQKRQLTGLRSIGPALIDTRTVDGLLECAAREIHRVVGADAVGLAVRDATPNRRVQQLIHPGKGGVLIEPARGLVQAVERHLMPHVLAQPDTLLWPDLETANGPWSKAFIGLGMTCLAAAPIRGAAEIQGLLWIARKGGERLDPSQLHLVETLCPLLAARLEMAQLNQRLQGLHLVDPVTDLPSHLQFERAMHKLVGRPGQRCAMIVVDLDRFTAVNDDLGREAADAILRAVAGRLLAACRKSGFLARFAGAAFGLLMPGVTPPQAAALADRLRQAVSQGPLPLADGASLGLTASVGVACFPDDAIYADDLLDLALLRVMAAKRGGPDTVVTADQATRLAS